MKKLLEQLNGKNIPKTIIIYGRIFDFEDERVVCDTYEDELFIHDLPKYPDLVLVTFAGFHRNAYVRFDRIEQRVFIQFIEIVGFE